MDFKFGFLIVLCVVFVTGQNVEDERKCAKNGEYCQNHWDCCSNTCLTFLYKCTKTNNPLNMRPSTLLANRVDIQEPSITLDQLLESIFGSSQRPQNNLGSRIGDSRASSQGFGSCKANGSKCLQNDECCTNVCHGFLHQCVT